MKFKRILISTVLVLGISPALVALRAQEEAKNQKVESPKVLAVLFYADWCNSCKALEPNLNKVKRDFQGQSILFTRFDLTDDFTKDQSAQYAALLGLENYYQENAGKTGYMLLIDRQSKKVLGRITKQNSPEEIKAAFSNALAGKLAAG
jgi:thiol-disulfide isomerase/thioredoxin